MTEKEQKPRIFIVDNEIEICNLLKDFFDFIGYQASYETDGEKAFRELENIEYELLFVDLRLDTISGIEILEKSKEINPLSEVLVITGYGSEETILQTLQLGAFSYIQKPISFSEIKVQAEEAIAKYRFNSKTLAVKTKISGIEPNLTKHFDDIVHLDKFSELLNLTIDIDALANSILKGITNLIPDKYYSFLFFDEINKEMIINSIKPASKKTIGNIQNEMKKHFEKLTNVKIGKDCNFRITMPDSENGKDVKKDEKLSHIFVPFLIENNIRGMLGVSGVKIKNIDYVQDILHIVSGRISDVLTNATLHRNTKLLALTDGLTGLLNRSAFHERLESEFQRYRRYGSYLSLIVADFDNLKEINDNYGHPVGDEVIKKIGDILRETSRESDVLTRYGGDEFVLVLPQTNSDNAYNMAERIRSKIEVWPFKINAFDFKCTISLGVATVPGTKIESSEDLLESADRALYESKRSGRNMVSVYK
ncbi:diguanylate cyclase [Candidatus Latescibacterota bacterium]